jgi:polysaccharide export outer membrane protein
MMTRMSSLVLGMLLAFAIAASARQNEYIVGPQDVLTVTVYDQADLTGKYPVDADGTLTFPLIGRVKVGGLNLRGVEAELKKQLANGYLKNPQVSVAVEQFKSQRIFVMGEVRAPGTYPLSGEMTVIEALARAGSTTNDAADEVMIVRPPAGSGGSGPVLPDQQADATVIRVNVRELQAGKLSQNVALHDGDTLVVPRAQSVFVFGQVKTPGAYSITQGTTVLQALSLAGGVTDRGSTGRVYIVRTDADGKKRETKVKLTDVVQPGDTLVVKERFF